jgi:hypothetical protein
VVPWKLTLLNIPVPSALDQLETYLSGVTGDISGNLFVIETGANDIFFDLNITAKEPLNSVKRIIDELQEHGETCQQHHYIIYSNSLPAGSSLLLSRLGHYATASFQHSGGQSNLSRLLSLVPG